MLLFEATHQRVPVHLCDDRGGGDRAVEGIAPHEGGLCDGYVRDRAGVDEQVVRRPAQGSDGATHGLQGRLQDVDAIDLLSRRLANSDGHGLLSDGEVELLARLAAQLL